MMMMLSYHRNLSLLALLATSTTQSRCAFFLDIIVWVLTCVWQSLYARVSHLKSQWAKCSVMRGDVSLGEDIYISQRDRLELMNGPHPTTAEDPSVSEYFQVSLSITENKEPLQKFRHCTFSLRVCLFLPRICVGLYVGFWALKKFSEYDKHLKPLYKTWEFNGLFNGNPASGIKKACVCVCVCTSIYMSLFSLLSVHFIMLSWNILQLFDKSRKEETNSGLNSLIVTDQPTVTARQCE